MVLPQRELTDAGKAAAQFLSLEKLLGRGAHEHRGGSLRIHIGAVTAALAAQRTMRCVLQLVSLIVREQILKIFLSLFPI